MKHQIVGMDGLNSRVIDRPTMEATQVTCKLHQCKLIERGGRKMLIGGRFAQTIRLVCPQCEKPREKVA